jgi:hypothetical protein
MLKNEDVCIQLRDIHGNRTIRRFDSTGKAYKWAEEMARDPTSEEYEILVVTQGEYVLYSALSAEDWIDFLDLTAFFG